MKKVALSQVKDDLSKYLRMAEKEQVIITRHGKPVAKLVFSFNELPRVNDLSHAFWRRCLIIRPKVAREICNRSQISRSVNGRR